MEKEESVLDEFKDVFQGLGRLKQKQIIRLKPECEPVIHPARRVPYRLQEQFDKTLSDMESIKIITKVTEPTELVNPIVTVRKSPCELRICLDPLDLNKTNAGRDCRETAQIEILQYARCYFGVSTHSARRRQ